MSLRCLCSYCLFLLLGSIAAGQSSVLPPGEKEPLIHLEAGGPTSLVTGLAISPDGEALYEAGWDKVVRVWTRDAQTGAFVLDTRATYRIPIGPGVGGAINAMTLSSDGTWLAVAGNGIVRGGAGFRQSGLIVPTGALSEEMSLDQGMIYVFNTRTEPRTVRILRGQLGPVFALAFAPARTDKPPLLVSAAWERDRLGVVRVWDVQRGESQGELKLRDPVPATRPGLAIWHTGPGPKQMRIGVAWGDGKLRLWDVENNRGGPTSLDFGGNNDTLASLPVSGRLLAGCLRNGDGQVTLWNTDREGSPRSEASSGVLFSTPDKLPSIPRAIALVPSEPGAEPHQAAVVLFKYKKDQVTADRKQLYSPSEASLQFIDLSHNTFGALGTRIPLWQVDALQRSAPVVAVDTRGRYLAVAGNPNREIAVYKLPDLLHGRAEPQRLRGAGLTILQVAFVKKGADWGLRLRGVPAGSPGEGDTSARGLTFDFSQRRLTADDTVWTDTADPSGWSLKELPPQRNAQGQGRGLQPSFSVRQSQGPEHRIWLQPGQTVTASALLPPRPPRREPIVALALRLETGVPALGLYNGVTGEPFRYLTGHSERIRGLAFSDDGRLLASTADDRTTCVWSLTDLEQILDKRGLLAGVAATEKNGGLVVVGVEPGSPAQAGGALREGDAIRGVVMEGELRPLASISDFYQSLSLFKPGQTVTIRRARGRQGEADVSLPIGQAIDERKPLLCLFVAQGDKPRSWVWIGWSPLGPYDASDRSAEHLFGWHFNTGQPEAPARFALTDQYRETFHRTGVLKDLIERGSLAPPQAPPPLPRPNMSMSIDPEGEVDGHGELLLRQPPAMLSLVLLDRRINVDQVERVQWKIDDSPMPDLSMDADRVWTADLSKLSWNRDSHAIVVTLRTRETTPQEFSEKRFIRFVPRPPSIKAQAARATLVVDRPEFTFEAQVFPTHGRIEVSLSHKTSNGTRFQKKWESDDPLQIKQPLMLDPETNEIELVAKNQGAARGNEGLETARLRQVVLYNRAPVMPPTMALETVISLRNASDTGPRRTLGQGEPIVVDVPRVRIEGKISAQEPLSQADWLSGEKEVGRKLAGFVPDRDKSFAVSEVIELEPESRTLRFRAKAADSEFAEAQVRIEYRPQVPEVTDVTFEPPNAVIYQGPSGDPARIRVQAKLTAPADRQPFEAVIVNNGTELPDQPVIDEAAGTLTAHVTLQPGDNGIQFRLKNRWKTMSTTEPASVTYRRPPCIIAVAKPAVSDKPFIDVSASVESPADLPLTRAQIQVGRGGAGIPEKVVDSAEFHREGTRWVITAANVPIEPGENALRVWAWNQDGRCLAPGLATGIVYKAPPAPKAEIVFLNPGCDTSVSTEKLALEFRVRSASPLQKVELLRLKTETDREVLLTADVNQARKDKQGFFEIRPTRDVTLEHRDNTYQVVAANDGGETVATLVLSYLPPPVRVVIDQLEPRARNARPIVPVVGENNRLYFLESLPEGKVWLHGRVIWPDAETMRIRETKSVEIWINGLHQVDADLQPRTGHDLEKEFRVGATLSRKANRIEVKLTGIAREASDRPEFQVSCLREERRQRLHLLIVGVGEQDETELRDRALNALQGRLKQGSTIAFETPAFAEGQIYGPLLSHDVTRHGFVWLISKIKNNITPRNTDVDASNEVVAIYFQGAESLSDGRSYLRLGNGRSNNPNDIIAIDELVNFFAKARGAQIYLLDVTRSSTPTPIPLARSEPGTNQDSSVALLRVSWLDQANASPSKSPQDARLIAALQETIPSAPTLKAVVAKLSEKYKGLAKTYPDLIFENSMSAALADLLIGTP